jgi:hypothetical protein
MTVRRMLSAAALAWGLAAPAAAQGWEFDARKIALGAGDVSNLAVDVAFDEQQPYRAIVLPFGLVQVLHDFEIYNPSSPRFDPVLAIEHLASPLHFIVNRDEESAGQVAFLSALRSGQVSPDLNAYRGFSPPEHLALGQIAAPSWGRTLEIARRDRATHAVFIGAGPYLSVDAVSDVDARLIALLASATPSTIPNATLRLSTVTQAQAAAAISVGYRGRFAFGDPSGRDSLFVAANYRYLIGFWYDDEDVRLRLDTDAAGLLTLVPGVTPFTVARTRSTGGHGRAIDLGAGLSIGRVTLAGGVNGIANHIDWTGVTHSDYTLADLLSGVEFTRTPTLPAPDLRVALPVDVRGDVAYDAGAWTMVGQIGTGLGGRAFHTGVERRLEGGLAVRGGVRYSFERWDPAGGVGFAVSPRMALDVAAFGTSVNLERRRLLGIAASIRINQPR